MSESSRQQSYANHGHRPYLTWVASISATAALVIFAGDWLRGLHSGQIGLVLLAVATVVLVWISKFGQLKTAQLVGLRFASDAELPALADRAIAERLSRDDIKRAIKTWVPDWERT